MKRTAWVSEIAVRLIHAREGSYNYHQMYMQRSDADASTNPAEASPAILSIPELRAALKDAAKHPQAVAPKAPTKADRVRKLKPDIVRLHRRVKSWHKVAEFLRARGFDVSADTVKSVCDPKKKERVESASIPDTKRKVIGPRTNGATKSFGAMERKF